MKKIICLFFDLINFLRDLTRSHYILYQLTKRDFKNKYLGTYFGLPWAFIQPIVFMLVMWFVFTVGFRTDRPNERVPFIVWLMAGMIPWSYVSDTMTSSTQSVVEYGYLLKKVTIRASIIPLIKIISGLIIHIFFILFLSFVASIYGFFPSVYYIQIIYYLLATIVFIMGVSYLTSSIMVFVRDVGQVMSVAILANYTDCLAFFNFKAYIV